MKRRLGQEPERISAYHPVFGGMLAAEDELFASLQHALRVRGLDLKTIMMLAHPSIHIDQLAWLDDITPRKSQILTELLEELTYLEYDRIVQLLHWLEEIQVPPVTMRRTSST